MPKADAKELKSLRSILKKTVPPSVDDLFSLMTFNESPPQEVANDRGEGSSGWGRLGEMTQEQRDRLDRHDTRQERTQRDSTHEEELRGHGVTEATIQDMVGLREDMLTDASTRRSRRPLQRTSTLRLPLDGPSSPTPPSHSVYRSSRLTAHETREYRGESSGSSKSEGRRGRPRKTESERQKDKDQLRSRIRQFHSFYAGESSPFPPLPQRDRAEHRGRSQEIRGRLMPRPLTSRLPTASSSSTTERTRDPRPRPPRMPLPRRPSPTASSRDIPLQESSSLAPAVTEAPRMSEKVKGKQKEINDENQPPASTSRSTPEVSSETAQRLRTSPQHTRPLLAPSPRRPSPTRSQLSAPRLASPTLPRHISRPLVPQLQPQTTAMVPSQSQALQPAPPQPAPPLHAPQQLALPPMQLQPWQAMPQPAAPAAQTIFQARPIRPLRRIRKQAMSSARRRLQQFGVSGSAIHRHAALRAARRAVAFASLRTRMTPRAAQRLQSRYSARHRVISGNALQCMQMLLHHFVRWQYPHTSSSGIHRPRWRLTRRPRQAEQLWQAAGRELRAYGIPARMQRKLGLYRRKRLQNPHRGMQIHAFAMLAAPTYQPMLSQQSYPLTVAPAQEDKDEEMEDALHTEQQQDGSAALLDPDFVMMAPQTSGFAPVWQGAQIFTPVLATTQEAVSTGSNSAPVVSLEGAAKSEATGHEQENPAPMQASQTLIDVQQPPAADLSSRRQLSSTGENVAEADAPATIVADKQAFSSVALTSPPSIWGGEQAGEANVNALPPTEEKPSVSSETSALSSPVLSASSTNSQSRSSYGRASPRIRLQHRFSTGRLAEIEAVHRAVLPTQLLTEDQEIMCRLRAERQAKAFFQAFSAGESKVDGDVSASERSESSVKTRPCAPLPLPSPSLPASVRPGTLPPATHGLRVFRPAANPPKPRNLLEPRYDHEPAYDPAQELGRGDAPALFNVGKAVGAVVREVARFLW